MLKKTKSSIGIINDLSKLISRLSRGEIQELYDAVNFPQGYSHRYFIETIAKIKSYLLNSSDIWLA